MIADLPAERGTMAEAINVMPEQYAVTREYMQLRLWEMLNLDLVAQASLTPGQLEHLLNYVRVRQVEEMRKASL